MLRLIMVAGGMLGTVVSVVTVGVVMLLSSLQPISGSGVAHGKQAVIVAHAEVLQEHIWGAMANEYDLNDPVMQPFYQFWLASCGWGGQVCTHAQSGNLQCVMFVSGVFALSGVPLPVLDDAQKLWPLYRNRPGWLEIPVREAYPMPGDMMVWAGGPYGHVAVVVQVVLPTATQDGSVTVAQANAMGNRWPPDQRARAGNFLTMSLLRDGTVPSFSPDLSVLGYIRSLGD